MQATNSTQDSNTYLIRFLHELSSAILRAPVNIGMIVVITGLTYRENMNAITEQKKYFRESLFQRYRNAIPQTNVKINSVSVMSVHWNARSDG
jgi:hypothetical protein